MINGHIYDSESVKIILPSGMVVNSVDVSYGMKKPKDVVTDGKGRPIGVVRKAFEGDFKITLDQYEYETLVSYLSSKGGILGCEPLLVSISYGNAEGDMHQDILKVVFTEVPHDIKKDEEIKKELTGVQVAIPTHDDIAVYTPEF